jgi:hypothetical protein
MGLGQRKNLTARSRAGRGLLRLKVILKATYVYLGAARPLGT